MFILQPSKSAAAEIVIDLRARAVAEGRAADDLVIFNMATVVTGPDEAAALKKIADYRRYASTEGWLVIRSGGTGIDLGKYSLDEPPPHAKTEAVQSIMRTGKGEQRTVRELAERNVIGSGSALIVGSPDQVADELEAWVDETGIDGFNLASVVMPETFTDFVDLVVPELQRRGRMKQAYAPGPCVTSSSDERASHPRTPRVRIDPADANPTQVLERWIAAAVAQIAANPNVARIPKHDEHQIRAMIALEGIAGCVGRAPRGRSRRAR